jgi:hypothetical protein
VAKVVYAIDEFPDDLLWRIEWVVRLLQAAGISYCAFPLIVRLLTCFGVSDVTSYMRVISRTSAD